VEESERERDIYKRGFGWIWMDLGDIKGRER